MKQRTKLFHIVTGVCVAVIILLSVFQGSFNIWKLFDSLLATSVFYFHALVLLPLLFIPKAINRYVLFTFGLFAISAVVSATFIIASRSDYVYIFSKILYQGPAFDSGIEYMYKTNFLFFILLFTASLLYGLLVSKRSKDFSFLAHSVWGEKHTELLVHIILLLLISITSYFAGVFLNNLLLAGLLLFYFHLLVVSPFWVKEKKTAKSFVFIMAEIIAFNGLVYFFTEIYGALPISLSISILTIATIYAIVKQQFSEKESQFSKKELELQQLKSQVNPHFLFNTMNTLYSFALKENAEKTASNIKKLSNLIRFMLTDIEKDYIPLQNEVRYIKDYIDIQLARCSSKQNIKFHINNIDGFKIAPMLLFPFVENAFKHGINPGEESTLALNLSCEANAIQFECHNSLNQNYKGDIIEQGFGIGLKNIKSRLEIIYPKMHILEITKNANEFSVKLEIYDNSNCD